MFKTHEKNIPQIKGALKAYPAGVWFHGCGNIYVSEKASDDRKNFTNPNSEEATYRIHFTSVDQVPATLDELNKKLMASRVSELAKEKTPKISQGIATFSIDTDGSELHPDDAELQRLIDEENAKKGK